MGRAKTYNGDYESKLNRVMERLGVLEHDYNWDRHGCWVQFRYKGELYRFDHSVAKAKSRGVDLVYGSDAFAQVVLALEDLARMVERGIYELQTWVAGMKYLPTAVEVPSFFRYLGFTEIPASREDVSKTVGAHWPSKCIQMQVGIRKTSSSCRRLRNRDNDTSMKGACDRCIRNAVIAMVVSTG